MQTFSAREHAWQRELDGIELAGFCARAFAFLIDWIIVGVALMLFTLTLSAVIIGIRALHFHSWRAAVNFGSTQLNVASIKIDPDKLGAHAEKFAVNNRHPLLDEIVNGISDVLIPILYFGILLWRGQGQTPGKRLMKIRVVSIVHPHLSFWHSVERALGYGAATLEAGLGFIQYFLHPYRRCAQDRLAETIVVTEAAYQQMLTTQSPHDPHPASALSS